MADRALSLCVLGGLLGAPATAAQAAPVFPNLAHTVGDMPVAVAAGDLDADGRPDLVVANRWSEDLSVLIGRGDGDFKPERRFPAGGIPVAVALADFDADGRPDVAVALPVEDRVLVFRTLPGGDLAAPLPLAAGDSPGALIAGDFDGDGAADLAIANFQSDDVTFLSGHGDGGFGAPRTFPAGHGPHALLAGLFDGDLRVDLAIANERSGDVSILLGDAATGFRAGGVFPTGAPGWFAAPRRLVSADFDRDGAADLVAGNFDNVEELNSLVLLPGRGDGTFANGLFVERAADGDLALGAADFNRDGRADLAFGAHHGAFCCGTRSGRIAFGRGDGTFEVNGAYRTGNSPVSLAVADLDGDATSDLAVISDFGWGLVAIDLGQGDGRMGRDPLILDPGGLPFDVVPGDFDGDGRIDLVAAEPFLSRLRFLRGVGVGAFEAPFSLESGGFPDGLTVGDFNGDGLDDVAALDRVSDQIILFVSTGGGFSGPSRLQPGMMPLGLAAADVTGDGTDDLLAACAGGEVAVYSAPGGAPGTPLRLPSGSDDARAVAVADVDGDGLEDIVVAGESLAVLRALAPGTFAAPRVVDGVNAFAVRLATGDLNHDGRDDVVITWIPGVRLYTGRADGGLEPGPVFGLSASPERLAMADLDSDGLVEILALEGADGSLDVAILDRPLLGGTASRHLLGGGDLPAMGAGDLDGDGRIDVVVASPLGGLAVTLNQGGPANHAPHAVPSASMTVECTGPAGAAIVLDGSGSTDPDSTPGTQDDLASFAWYEDFGLPSERLMADGAVTQAILPLGSHRLALQVLDRAGSQGVQEFVVNVVDTTRPFGTAVAGPSLLWPPNHRMAPVHAGVQAADLCGSVSVTLESATSSEPDDAPGGSDGTTVDDIQDTLPGTADFDLRLRAERSGSGSGRTYTLTYRATDASGNWTLLSATVTAPRSITGAGPGGPRDPRGPSVSRGRRGSPRQPEP